MKFPHDSDGEVLNRLYQDGFEFSLPTTIEFMVDFNSWPPTDKAINALQSEFGALEFYQPEDDCLGYVLFTISDILSYELVINTQAKASDLAQEFGGVCEAWGVFIDP
ncbi:ribonuclease E inhibitor RraB [Photobacterium swingsii]|uniref:ribonuclease E inhibitor RraB n=1 Tax=Photobacterium swingsii TaxID=680026 RepID=UPI00352DC15D